MKDAVSGNVCREPLAPAEVEDIEFWEVIDEAAEFNKCHGHRHST